MEIPVFTVDAFTTEAFKGNPAGVCFLDQVNSAEWMQKVASEMNLPATAFLVPRPSKDGFDLRWFTPAIEIPLCGHATLASAHALWDTGRLERTDEARFHTLSDWLICKYSAGKIEMDFPALPVSDGQLPAAVTQALGTAPKNVVINRRKDGTIDKFLLELESEPAVRSVKPDFDKLRLAINAGIIITAPGDSKGNTRYDFVSRYFACYARTYEDSVTGSAHCMLATYWAAKLGKKEMFAYQASARGGEINVKLNGDRVLLGGNAVTVMRGSLLC